MEGTTRQGFQRISYPAIAYHVSRHLKQHSPSHHPQYAYSLFQTSPPFLLSINSKTSFIASHFLAMPEQSSVPSFDEKVYALSKIVHQVKFRNNRSDKYTDSQRKHLRLLDDIALLLVTESGSDVAAVSFEQRPTEVIFYFAKNRPATNAEHDYIKELIKLARDTEATNRTSSIFNNVLHICRPKMLSRFDKLIRVLTKLTPAARSFHDDTNGDVDRHLQQQLGVWYDPKKGAVDFVTTFVSHLSTLAKLKQIPEPASLRQIVRVAHATGSFKPENTVYPDKDLTRRIRLLGDYYGAVKRIVRNADSIIGRAPRTVEFTEVWKP